MHSFQDAANVFSGSALDVLFPASSLSETQASVLFELEHVCGRGIHSMSNVRSGGQISRMFDEAIELH